MMPKFLISIALLLVFLLNVQSQAQQKRETEHLVICRSFKSVRTLRIEKIRGERCQAFYTKLGVDQSIGTSLSMDSCMEYINSVLGILKRAKWTCREVKGSTVSTLVETVN